MPAHPPQKAKSNIIAPLRPLAVPLDSLKPDPINGRLHSEENLAAIEAALSTYGQDQPLVVQKRGRVVRKGNGRLEAARRLGWTHIAAIIVDESDVDAVLRAIADNRSGELAPWSEEKLRAVLTLAQEAKQAAPVAESIKQTIAAIGAERGFGFLAAAVPGAAEDEDEPDVAAAFAPMLSRIEFSLSPETYNLSLAVAADLMARHSLVTRNDAFVRLFADAEPSPPRSHRRRKG